MAASCMSAQYCSPMGKVEAKTAAQNRASIFGPGPGFLRHLGDLSPGKGPKIFLGMRPILGIRGSVRLVDDLPTRCMQRL